MILKIINVLVYFAFFASIIFVTGSTSIFFDAAYVTPAPLAFFIGTVNHLLLLGSIVYQFFDSGELATMGRISWRFPLLVVLHAVYINLLLTRHYLLAFISALLVNMVATKICSVLRRHAQKSRGFTFLIYVPFFIYRGWTTVLDGITALEALGVNAQTDDAGIWTKIFACLALFILDRTAIHSSTEEGDSIGSYTIRVGLLAIAYYQTPILVIQCLGYLLGVRVSSNY